MTTFNQDLTWSGRAVRGTEKSAAFAKATACRDGRMARRASQGSQESMEFFLF